MPPKKRPRAEPSTASKRTFVSDTSPFSTGSEFSRGTTWPHHDESDDSDAYESPAIARAPKDSVRVYRALSERDSSPMRAGIKGADPRKRARTLAEHVQGGGGSRFISMTTSKRKALKWAVKGDNPPRIATIDLPQTTPAADFSFGDTAKRAGLGNTGTNFARSSSEVVVEGPIPSKYVKRVEAIRAHKSSATAGKHIVRTRAKTGLKDSRAKPRSFELLEVAGVKSVRAARATKKR